MASPGTVRLLTALRGGSLDEVRPILDVETGTVTYPDATEYLDDRDGHSFELLETLAERDLLYREFQEKQYICPRCESKGMQYTTACPYCDSPQTVRTDRYRHPDCGYEGLREQFLADDAVVCPNCDAELESLKHLESNAAHVCEECDDVFETPAHRLRCRDCHHVSDPLQTIERILYRYFLSERGAAWVDEQLTARQSLAEAFEERKLHTEIDTVVTDGAGEEVPIHLFARDDLLNDRVIAAVHERPDESAIAALTALASDVDARAALVTTSGEIAGEGASSLLADDGLTVLRLTKSDDLEREYEVVDDERGSNSFVGRLADIFKPQNG
jgi:Thaumarchaeal output domain 1